jgi:G3E family GTPase
MHDDTRPHVHILTGYLGSGKTTLLNRLLRDPALADAAVIVNEFGAVGIDHALVDASTDGVVLLSSGCLCCTVRSDLLATLSELTARRRAGAIPPFQRVVIETTGLADPAPILQALMSDYAAVSEYRIGRVITVVDALHGSRTLDERFEAVRQAAVADRIVISKTDLAEAGVVARLQARLAALNPLAEQIVSVQGDAASDRLLEGAAFDLATKSADVRRWVDDAGDDGTPDAHAHDHHHHHDDRIRAHCLAWSQPQPWDRIAAGLDRLVVDHGEQLLRVKGLVNVAGQDEPVVVQGVRNLFHPPSTLERWPDEDRRTRLVFITEGLDRADIERSIERGARDGVDAVEVF